MSLYKYDTHAVMLEWSMSVIGNECTIFTASDSSSLFEQIKDYVFATMENLLNEHRETINCADRNVIYEMFVDQKNPCFEDFDAEDVRWLLLRLIKEQNYNLKQYPNAPTIKGPWLDLIEYLNDYMDGDHLYVLIEGRLPEFSNELLRWIKDQKTNPNIYDIREARWISTLSNISNNHCCWSRKDNNNLWRLIDEFNHRYRFT